MSEEDTVNLDDQNFSCSKKCDSKVLDSVTLTQCNSKSHIPMGSTGPLVVKVPVVLSDLEIEIHVESEMKLEESATDIENIDKEVFITECKLIPYTNNLFIGGYVQKSIQFSIADCRNNSTISGRVEHTTVNVPFRCVTETKFSKEPIYGKNYKERINFINDNMLGKDKREDSWVHYSELYDAVYCQLEYAKVLEIDMFNEINTIKKATSEENIFKKLSEKMVIFIRLKVLQNQQIFIPEFDGDVIVIKDHNNDSNLQHVKDKNKGQRDIEIGFDDEKGVIGKEGNGLT